MPNPGDPPADSTPRNSDHSLEIERSLSSIWERRTGVRPASISAEVRSDAVRCAIKPGEPKAVEDDDSDDADVADDEETETSNAYSFRHESIAAVTKIMHRPVSAFIDREDPKQGAAQQTFIFERSRIRY
jgi:hypothetical protein